MAVKNNLTIANASEAADAPLVGMWQSLWKIIQRVFTKLKLEPKESIHSK